MTVHGNDQGGKRRFQWSIRWIVTGASVALVCATTLSVWAISEKNTREALSSELDNRLMLEARNLALSSSGPLLGDYPELTLHPLVKEMLAGQAGLAFAVVVDHEGRIQGHVDARELGARFTPPTGLEPAQPAYPLRPAETIRTNDEVRMIETPVTDLLGRPIGRAMVAMKRSHVEGLIAAARRQQLMVLAVFVLIGVISALLLMSYLFRPLRPLREGIERVGRGNLDSPIVLNDRTELGLLAHTVNDMAGALKRAQAEMLERERMSHEFQLAQQIQQSLLPSKPWSDFGTTVLGDQRAAAEVGGDHFEILPLSDGRVAIAVADVAGKGLAGCLMMTMVSSLLRAFRDVYDSPSALLTAMDERLSESMQPGTFVTMFYGILDPRNGRLVFASAGHNPMLIYRAASATIERVRSRGIPLAAIRRGIIRETLEDQTVTIRPGDLMVEYTDGYSEAPGKDDATEFGIERLEQVVSAHAPQGVAAVRTALRDAVAAWRGAGMPFDDETLLIVGRDRSARDLDVVEAAEANPGARAVAILVEAEQRGHRLDLPAQLGALAGIPQWIGSTPVLCDLRGSDVEVLGTALYEACSNVAEHGYDEDPRHTFTLWWLPPAIEGGPETAAEEHVLARHAAQHVREGVFVMCDQGRAFSPRKWRGSDFMSTQVWKRGRGFGLDILHRAMRELAFHPGTTRGNITLMAFGPETAVARNKEGLTP
jgi:serine phosphatase RsbU (regulator of sigma subunit)